MKSSTFSFSLFFFLWVNNYFFGVYFCVCWPPVSGTPPQRCRTRAASVFLLFFFISLLGSLRCSWYAVGKPITAEPKKKPKKKVAIGPPFWWNDRKRKLGKKNKKQLGNRHSSAPSVQLGEGVGKMRRPPPASKWIDAEFLTPFPSASRRPHFPFTASPKARPSPLRNVD